MNRFCLIFLVAWFVFLGIISDTQAKTIYLNFSGPRISGKGKLHTIKNQDGTLTAVSGNITAGYQKNGKEADGHTYSLITNKNAPSAYFASPLGLFIYDDTLCYPKAPYLDNWGLLFSDSAGTTELNIWCNERRGSCSASFAINGNYIKDRDVKLVLTSDTPRK